MCVASVLCSDARSLPTLWVGTSGGLVCVYEFTLGSTTDVEQSPPLKCVLGKPLVLLQCWWQTNWAMSLTCVSHVLTVEHVCDALGAVCRVYCLCRVKLVES